MQEVRGDGQKSHSQGRGLRGELAHGSKAQRYAAYGKCGACAPTVRVLTWAEPGRKQSGGLFAPGEGSGLSARRGLQGGLRRIGGAL